MWKYSQAPFAHEAQQDALDNPSHVLAMLAEVKAEVQSLAAVARPEYEYTGPISFGGLPAGNPYACAAPFAGPCEVAVISLATLAAENGNILLTTEQSANANLIATTGTATLPPTPFTLIITVTAAAVVPPITWYPLSGAATIYMTMSTTFSKSAYVTLQFRRRINPTGVPSQGYP